MIKRQLNYEDVYNTIVYQMVDYLRGNNIKALVNGVSGGIDSCVTSAIAYEVKRQMGKEFRLIGLSLPTRTNSFDETSIADNILRAFYGKDGFVHKIELTYDTVKLATRRYVYEDVLGEPVADGNIKARLRMIYLYDVASLNGGIVIDNSNRTETELGFWTLHGDVGDYAPIGNLWKTEVYGLARYIKTLYEDKKHVDENKVNAINLAISAMPTDGNGVKAGGDMAQIAPGSTYEIVDTILESYLDDPHPDNVSGLKYLYGEDVVTRVLDRHFKSAYKRLALPITPKF